MVKQNERLENDNYKSMETKPCPRETRLFNCIIISLYGASYLFFMKIWMKTSRPFFIIKFLITYILCITLHFLILYKRQKIYEILCQLTRERIRFFEFPYFVIVSICYLFFFLVWPFLLGLVELQGDISTIIEDQDLAMFILFGGGACFVTAAVSGFDIYPVNVFRSKTSLLHLIMITKDLITFSNRLLVFVTSAVIFGWAFKKVDFSMTIVYMTAYGVVGFAIGSTAVLGSRVTGMLYDLELLEEKQESDEQDILDD